jgi:hypothetical protein
MPFYSRTILNRIARNITSRSQGVAMPNSAVRSSTPRLIAEVKESIARFGHDLYHFGTLVRQEDFAKLEQDLVIFQELLAAVSAHMSAMRDRTGGAHVPDSGRRHARAGRL